MTMQTASPALTRMPSGARWADARLAAYAAGSAVRPASGATPGVRPRAAVVVLGAPPPGPGQAGAAAENAVASHLPAWLRRLGASMAIPQVIGPADGSLIAGIGRAQAAGADIVLVVGASVRHPTDPLRAALRGLGAYYLANDVQVRPGSPMLLATVATPAGGRTLLAGLPGRPQSAVVALLTLVAPAIDGMAGRSLSAMPVIELGAPIAGRGPRTRLESIRLGQDGRGYPVRVTGYAMLRGLARSAAFAVIVPHRMAAAGARVPVLPLPAGPLNPAGRPEEQVLRSVDHESAAGGSAQRRTR